MGCIGVIVGNCFVTDGSSSNFTLGGGTVFLQLSEDTYNTLPTYSGNYTLNSGTTSRINYYSNMATYTGVVSGAGNLVIDNYSTPNTGYIKFTKSETYTGATTINTDATLALNGAGSIATSSGVTDNGTLDIYGATAGVQVNALAGSGKVALGSRTLTIAGSSATFSGVIGATSTFGSGGTGGLTIANSETLSGTNLYSGVTTINSGATLTLAAAGSIANTSRIVANGTLVLNGQTLATAISGTGGVTAATSGATTTLSKAITYSGTTTVNTGATLAATSTVNLGGAINNSGTFDLSGAASGPTVLAVVGSAASKVILGANTLTLTNPNGNMMSGIISGTGGLAITNGSEVLNGANTYTGATTINGGGLKLSSTGSIANTSAIVINAGQFNLNGQTITAPISGAGYIVAQAATSTINGADTHTGIAQINSGATLALASTLTSYNSVSGITDNGTLQLNGQSIGKVISGTGGVTAASGTSSLSAANTYTGATTVNAGATLNLSGSLTSSLTIASGGIFFGTGSVAGLTNAGTLTPGGALWGTLTDTGAFGQSAGGELIIDIGGTAGSGAFSRITAAGAMALDGTLNLITLNGFTPGASSGSYTILTGGSLTGDFATLDLNGIACTAKTTDQWICGNLITTETLSGTSLALTFATAMPEPRTLPLFLTALTTVAYRRRRAA